jgi:hypothetical protein
MKNLRRLVSLKHYGTWEILQSRKNDTVNSVKWFSLCRGFCAEGNSESAALQLAKFEKDARGVDIERGKELAFDLRSELLEQAKAIPANQNNEDLSIETSDKRFFALLIGVQNYSQFPNLRSPLKDIGDLGQALETSYGFEVTKLENPKKSDVIQQLNILQKNLGVNDNLLIYFAGHGITELGEGFWLLRDAQEDDESTWIDHSYLKRKNISY